MAAKGTRPAQSAPLTPLQKTDKPGEHGLTKASGPTAQHQASGSEKRRWSIR